MSFLSNSAGSFFVTSGNSNKEELQQEQRVLSYNSKEFIGELNKLEASLRLIQERQKTDSVEKFVSNNPILYMLLPIPNIVYNVSAHIDAIEKIKGMANNSEDLYRYISEYKKKNLFNLFQHAGLTELLEAAKRQIDKDKTDCDTTIEMKKTQ